ESGQRVVALELLAADDGRGDRHALRELRTVSRGHDDLLERAARGDDWARRVEPGTVIALRREGRGRTAERGSNDRAERSAERPLRKLSCCKPRVCASSQRRTIHVEVLSFRVGRRTSRVDRCAGKLASISKRSKYFVTMSINAFAM